MVKGLADLPARIGEILATEDDIAAIAARYAEAEHMFFVGRVRGWPVAREGAQKLKEISHVHAEAYQPSELKHGPLCPTTNCSPRTSRPSRKSKPGAAR
ncbi:SIS domain-containing protein [Streptomyces sp. AA4]|uniref:SIS domain-containing protein n=1 Tax=Actinomycetes TaxID=1760 RepID=UPI0001B55A17|nr:SIS domain-containing protein [Streptomyces sp. AA4]EFL04414.1 glucosamine-fructose-6-phosphate aminotransferase [Streptomyces sp. AA4]